MQKYGTPYMGSKNVLAERIIGLLPRRTHFIDLFCGGCAVSHAAMFSGRFSHIHINDADWRPPTLFTNALLGRYADERRWISREDFFRLRDSDPYVAICWSFGNTMRTYMYASSKEPLKRAIHHAVLFCDYAPASALGIDFSAVANLHTEQERYSCITRICRDMLRGLADNSDLWQNPTGAYLPMKDLRERLTDGQQLQSYGRIKRLRAIARHFLVEEEPGSYPLARRFSFSRRRAPAFAPQRPKAHSLTMSVGDYAAVEIPTDSVIYCDIPYNSTELYPFNKRDGCAFDYSRFYDWTEAQREPVFISSYRMPPERFDCIAEWQHIVTVGNTSHSFHKERLFVPKGQRERSIADDGWIF